MFKHTKDNFINSTNGRLYVLLAVFLILYGILTVRIFYLQIVNGEETLNDFTLNIRERKYHRCCFHNPRRLKNLRLGNAFQKGQYHRPSFLQ